MPVHNKDVADSFDMLADLLEIRDANPFRVRAYRNAARTVRGLPGPVAQMVADGENLSDLSGIGADLAGKIEEIVDSGKLSLLEKVKKDIPEGLARIIALPGVGPKRAAQLRKELDIESIGDLAEAAEAGRIHDLEGFGHKTEERILSAIREDRGKEQRFLRAEVVEFVDSLLEYLRAIPGVKKVVAAGSYRRRRSTVGDIDLLVTCKRGTPVMDRFVAYDDVEEVVSKGETMATVRLRSDLQVDLRVVQQVAYGAALFYFTGSKAHNISVRRMAGKKNLKVNEYGVFRAEKRLAGATEEEVYREVDLPFIPPELREDDGEIEAARKGRLPGLLTHDDIRGNLHAHTKATDGKYSLREMAEAARHLGYEYLAITDHSQQVRMANGLDEKRLRRQITSIDKLNDELDDIRLLKGIEVDILEDGSLDLDDDVLAELDVVVGSIHSKFDLPGKKQTERVIRAMDNPSFNILGHPTGRLINRRPPYEVDVEHIMDAALERGCFLELNAQPERLDLKRVHCRLAREKGLRIAISTDAHTVGDLQFMACGVDEARRGWIEPDDVLNTRSWTDLKKLLKRD